MTDEIDYKKLYDDLKTSADAMESTLKKDIEQLNNTIKDKDTKIVELQDYICKNLTVKDKPKQAGESDNVSFEDRYKAALKEIKE